MLSVLIYQWRSSLIGLHRMGCELAWNTLALRQVALESTWDILHTSEVQGLCPSLSPFSKLPQVNRIKRKSNGVRILTMGPLPLDHRAEGPQLPASSRSLLGGGLIESSSIWRGGCPV